MNKQFAKKLMKENIETYEEIAGHFDQTRQWIPPEYKQLQQYIKPESKILDLGCGNGRLYEIIRKKEGVEYTGVDNSENLIKIASKKYPEAHFKKASALDIPFPEEEFDQIISYAVLHHIPGVKLRHTFLKEARRVLKKDGVFFAIVWNLWQKQYIELIFNFTIKKILGKTKLDFKDILKTWGNTDKKRYYHAFTPGELKKSAQKAGFTKIKVSHLKRNGRTTNFLLKAHK